MITLSNPHALDYGANSKLAVHGPSGPVKLPRITAIDGYYRGMNSAEQFALKLAYLLSLGDVVTEAATIGASGAEVSLIRKAVASAPHRLFTLSGRAVKNHAKDNGLTDLTDADSARIQYEIATSTPDALMPWTDVRPRRVFKYRSVRPFDKRDYKDPFVYEMLATLPDISLLPDEFQQLLGNSKVAEWNGYNAPDALPLAMSLTEDGAESSRYWTDTILGFWHNGKPSFYRRKVGSDLVQDLAKLQTGKTLVADITRDERKAAQKSLKHYLKVMHYFWRQEARFA
jgi:hypothetical protein